MITSYSTVALAQENAKAEIKLPYPSKRLQVLLINSGNQYLPMEQNILTGLKSKLAKNSVAVDVYPEYLDSARFNEDSQNIIFADYLRKKYIIKPLDLVISNGIPSANFLTRNTDLFKDIKHVFVRSGNIPVSHIEDRIDIAASNNYRKSVRDLINLTKPKKIVVIADSSSSLSREHFKNLKAEFDLLHKSIEVHYVIDAPLSTLERTVSSQQPGSVVIFTPIFRHQNGTKQTPYKTVNGLIQMSKVPIFSFWGSLIGSGVIGGYMLSGEKVGEAMGDTIIDFATGKNIKRYPIEFFNQHIYDWRQLKKYKYDVLRHFDDAQIEFYQPSFIEKYKMGILLTIVIFLVLMSFIFLLVLSNTKRKDAIGDLKKQQDLLEQRVNERTEELLSSKQRAEAASVAKSDFLANMSHEIRTPMNGVMGMLGLLKNTTIDEQQKHYVNIAESSSQSLLTVINDILDFSKIEAGKLEIEIIDFNLLLLIEDCISSMSFLAYEKELKVNVDTKHVENIYVKGDPNRIRQVFINLLSNAIKFTAEGNIVIVAKTELTKGKIALSINITDSGIGIENSKIDTLFTAFTQADTSTTRKYGGSGLGLSICMQLCKLMGGSISVISSSKKGSTFTATFCLEEGEILDNEITTIDISGKNILIVDDNKVNRDILIEQLRYWGGNAFSTVSSRETLALLTSEQSPSVDIIILDFQMPEMNGIELGSAIHEIPKYHETKLLMMTSVMLDKSFQYYIDNGFSAYLLKPTAATKLVKALSLILSQPENKTSQLITEHNVQENFEVQEKTQEVDYSHKTLLLVEDNRINQQVALGVIKYLNLQYRIAENGLEALNLLERGENIDIVLMDCQMPVMDGFEATQAIRASEKIANATSLPIIALTANSMEGDREKCLASGMNDFLAKPIVLDHIKRKLIQFLEK